MNKPETGYISDYDILVIVDQYDLVAKFDLWNTIEDRVRVFLPPFFKLECNLTVHTSDEVNNTLKEGQYFFTGIKDQGIAVV
ncbi:hypothetical protein HUE58_02235 [Candidatus Ruthia endofausta]|uniref:Nucleotidyltransferase domain-containing protein n=1 Tax=Candidatus Ruthia endofausta TaxID=2738852 RepID=A0A6N0HNW3_9GAMM|nr:hypothetical protein [Candidatus Ruthia endofausta]QKQ23870.1 hypothetical protein HUE58_01425 [Candidatus Ruthia endofausta]QKQ24006.1 hypothetical protein HUE58_02235 [Candidatus Ruthia endofausta]